jgi:hypothetical protein
VVDKRRLTRWLTPLLVDGQLDYQTMLWLDVVYPPNTNWRFDVSWAVGIREFTGPIRNSVIRHPHGNFWTVTHATVTHAAIAVGTERESMRRILRKMPKLSYQ